SRDGAREKLSALRERGVEVPVAAGLPDGHLEAHRGLAAGVEGIRVDVVRAGRRVVLKDEVFLVVAVDDAAADGVAVDGRVAGRWLTRVDRDRDRLRLRVDVDAAGRDDVEVDVEVRVPLQRDDGRRHRIAGIALVQV